MPITHELKTLAPYWDALDRGEKTFEVRRDDRGFQKGDTLALHRMDDERPHYYSRDHEGSKRMLLYEITYVLTGGQFGVEPGYVVMGIKRV